LKINNFTKFLGQVPREAAISITKGSTVILLIGGKRSDYHFPYKTIEYVASNRPIIAIRQSNTDLGANFIEKHNLGVVVCNDKEEIAKAINYLYTLWKNKILEKTFSHIKKEKLSCKMHGNELEELLLKVIINVKDNCY